MSSADSIVTVLLAAPCDARDALRSALEATTRSLIEVDPLTANADSVLKHAPRNVVVLLDGNTEDALEKFDSVLADPTIRLLFEEASVVTSRQGWDSARWSRHLAAKLIGSDDVLPEGVGDDQGFVAPKPRDAVRKPSGEMRAAAAEDGEPEREPVFFDPGAVDAFEAVPDIEEATIKPQEPAVTPPQAAAEAPSDLEDASWQMFQAYDVEDEWKPVDATKAPQHDDLDALISSASAEDVETPAHLAAEDSSASEAEDDATLASEFNFQTGLSPAILQSNEALEAPAQPNDLPSESATIRATHVTAALDAPVSPDEWVLTDPNEVQEAPQVVQESSLSEFDIPGSRFSTLSLLDDGTDGLETDQDDEDSTHEGARSGAVFLIGGAGGPDPLRTVLGALPAAFPRPVLIIQHLDANNYDRLARQMERASNMRVELAVDGTVLQAGTAYVISPGIDVVKTPNGYSFKEDPSKRGFVDFSGEFPGSDSAMVFLSGADVELSEAGSRFKARGAWLAAQAESGCFDFAVPSIMISRGAEALEAMSIAQNLTTRWSKEEHE